MTRSTGYRSANTHIHGHCQDIARQTPVPKPRVYLWICLLAAELEVIPTVETFGLVGPQPEPLWTSAQAAAVVDLLHAEADTRGWWLTEYDDSIPPKAVRMWAGKPKEEPCEPNT
jgi:hypothetical protein